MDRLPPASRHDAAALGAVALLLAGSHLIAPPRTVRYAVWLVVFCIWMAWFVSLAVRVLPRVDR